MKKILASLSGLTLSLTPVVGIFNSNNVETISHIVEEEAVDLTDTPCSTPVIFNESEVTKDDLDSISQTDEKTLSEILAIVKQLQQANNNPENLTTALMTTSVGAMPTNIEEILIKILKNAALAAGASAWNSIKEEFGNIFK